MKKIPLLTSLLLFIFLQVGFSQTAIQPSGEGTFQSPYLIENIGNLYWLSQNPTEWAKRFYQTVDIDATDTENWEKNVGFSPIGNATTKFSGFYNGQGHSISNLYINRPETNEVGFFGQLYLAYIRNLSLVNVNITGANSVGGLIGDTYNLSDISNCSVSGTVNGVNDVGGLAGISTQTVISNCYTLGSVISTGIAGGGLVGTSRYGSDIYNCYSRAQVTGNDAVGGLVGNNVYEYNQVITIVNCYSTGLVTGSTQFGGLVGVNNGDVYNSFWDTETSGIMSSTAGTGLITVEAINPQTFLDVEWDLNFCWALNSEVNSGYPYILSPINPVGAAPTSGDGTIENPFQIASLQNLVWLSKSPIHWDKYFIQTANIDAFASQTEGWNWSYGFMPIGNGRTNFVGHYDGQGFSIQNLNIERDTWGDVGLFGYAYNARIGNLNVENADINGKKATGIIVGQSAGNTEIINCHSSGNVDGLWKDIGGMVGLGSCVLWDCSSSANVQALSNAGGLMGTSSGSSHIFRCYASGSVEASGFAGGLAGYIGSSIIEQCYSSSSVSGDYYIGGLVGTNAYNSQIKNSYAYGTTNCVGVGGGLVGRNFSSSLVSSCYSRGLVMGTESAGGLIGGTSTSETLNSFWDVDVSTQPFSLGGTGKSSTQMINVDTYTNLSSAGLTEPWDFVYNPNDDSADENIWNISETEFDGYPFLNWQCPIPKVEWQPEIDEVCEGGTATFSFSVTSESSVEYQWQIKTDTEFEDIADANSSNLEFADVMQAHNGALFRCIATNTCGYLVSNKVELIVLDPTQLVTEPESQIPCAGETVEFTVEATGSYLYYEWFKNDVQIEGIEGLPTLTLINVTEEDNGTYKCIVTGDCGSVESQEVTLDVVELDVSINYTEENYLIANIEVAQYQWYRQENDCSEGLNLTIIEGETNQILMPSYQFGYYAVQITSNSCTQMSDCIFHVWGSVNNNSINTLALYPNPANSKVTIGNISGAKGVLRIISVMSKVVAELKIEEEEQVVDISDYPKGVYIFEIVYENQTLRERVVKN